MARADVFEPGLGERPQLLRLFEPDPARDDIDRSAKPGSTKPPLRPEASLATRWASRTTTDQPRHATSRAT